MKIVHFTNNTLDGAGKAVLRIHRALLSQGLNSVLLVSDNNIDDDSIKIINGKNESCGIKDYLCLFYNRLYRKAASLRSKPKSLFNFNTEHISFRQIEKYLLDVDVICLHSIQTFISTRLIREIYCKTKIPMVWTLLDIEPLSGGCHFNNGCQGFSLGCGNCPELNNNGKKDLSYKILKRKIKDLKDVPITLVAANSWVREHIQKSVLFKDNEIKDIFLSVDKIIKNKIDKNTARDVFNLPSNDKIILFGAFSLASKRKGAAYLKEALSKLPKHITQNSKEYEITLVTFGGTDGFSFEGSVGNWIHLGHIRDNRLLEILYQAADVLASPSLDDFGPMMVNEAFMNDLPVVAFDIGVAKDLLQIQQAGYVVKCYDTIDFAEAIRCCLQQKTVVPDLGIAHLKEKSSAKYQAAQYSVLFYDLKNKEN